MHQERHCCLYFLHVYNNYVAKKHVRSKFTSTLRQPITLYLLRWHCNPTHVQYNFNNLTENVLQSTTNKAYLFPRPVTNWTCQHLPPFSPTQKCYFPFIQLYIQSLWLTSTLSWRYHLPTQKIRSLNNTPT